MKSLVSSLDMRDSEFVSREILDFVIEEFASLKTLCISDCTRISVVELIEIFTGFKNRHNETSTGEYRGRKLLLEAFDFNNCGTTTGFYWYEGQQASSDLGNIQILLADICVEGLFIANTMCEECRFGVAYKQFICGGCLEGSDHTAEVYTTSDEYSDFCTSEGDCEYGCRACDRI
jgi:hypothetical protein